MSWSSPLFSNTVMLSIAPLGSCTGSVSAQMLWNTLVYICTAATANSSRYAMTRKKAADSSGTACDVHRGWGTSRAFNQ